MSPPDEGRARVCASGGDFRGAHQQIRASVPVHIGPAPQHRTVVTRIAYPTDAAAPKEEQRPAASNERESAEQSA